VKLVAFAGLPGTGKSTLARALAHRLDCPLFDKDALRAALFRPSEIEYSRAQDELVIECMQRAAEHLLLRGRVPVVVFDGRTYSRRAQVAALRDFARRLETPLFLIECTAAPAVARARLARDLAAGLHPAADRTPELYERLRAGAEPIEGPKLLLATDEESPEALLERVLDFVAGSG
jgi:predicted kinase